MRPVWKMRLYALAALAAALVGCGALSPAKFDPVQQVGYASLWQHAVYLEQACNRGERDRALEAELVSRMYDTAMLLGAYVRYQEDEGASSIITAFQHLQDKAQPALGESAAFCAESAKNLQAAAVRAMQTLGRRER